MWITSPACARRELVSGNRFAMPICERQAQA
jgi:hypothetical protein